jgi:DNA polymerase IV
MMLNQESPRIMHIDLNSCFAMIEQQARPSLRYRPIAVTNRIVKRSCVVACSYEAKRLGVRVGMRFDEAQRYAPDLIMVETDPPKYHYAYQKMVEIMKSYSPNIEMKSIDEGVIDFHGTPALENLSMEDIGQEIKQRLKYEIGEYVTCNIGIATNRVLAKTAAGMHKPDGMTRIDHTNLREQFAQLKLTDFPGIAGKYERRLWQRSIMTPLHFLDASAFLLRHGVFRSILGEYWHQRLRGFEVDDVTTSLGVVGRQFVMDKKTNDEAVILPRLHHLCQSTGQKLRYNEVVARGVVVWARMVSGETFLRRHMFGDPFYTDQAIYERAKQLFDQRPKHLRVGTIGVSCYGLSHGARGQLSFLQEDQRAERLTSAIDIANYRFGNHTLTYANALEGKSVIKTKLPFGSTKYFEMLSR